MQKKKTRNKRRKNPPDKLFTFKLTIKSKMHPLARQTDQSKKAMCPTHLTGKEETYSGLPCEKGELLVEHLKQTSYGMVLFDPLPFSNILFIFQHGSTKQWSSVLNPLSDATNYKFTPLRGDTHTSPSPPLFSSFFSFCLLKRAFSLLMLSTMIRSLCVSCRVLIFFNNLNISQFPLKWNYAEYI